MSISWAFARSGRGSLAPLSPPPALLQRLSLWEGETAVQVSIGLSFLGVAHRLWGKGDTFSISDSFLYFRTVVSEDNAALVLFAAGLLALLAPLTPHKGVQVLVSLLLGTMSGIIAIGCYRGHPLSVLAVLYASPIMFLSYWLMWRRACK